MSRMARVLGFAKARRHRRRARRPLACAVQALWGVASVCGHVERCALNGRILLVNLLPCNMAAFSASDFLCCWTFKDGMCEAQFSALRG